MNYNKNEVLAREVKERASFEALLKVDGCKFQGHGGKCKCFCPFHVDELPTFSINRNDADGSCVHCGWFGDAFDYVMEAHNVDFRTALNYLKEFVANHPSARRKEDCSQGLSFNIPRCFKIDPDQEAELLQFLFKGNK